MVSLYAVWVPAFVVAHLIGILLLLYSLEQVGGHVSKFFRRIFCMASKRQLLEGADETDAVEAGKEKGNVPVEGEYTVTVTSGVKHISVLGVPLPAMIGWKNVGCSVLDTKRMEAKAVLTGCSGTASPGETVALLGPSGAGKTTLLDVLAGRRSGKKVVGEVTMNGAPCGLIFHRISAYVPQEDCFVPTLTAMETLKTRAHLTVPDTVLKSQRNERIKAVLEVMGLSRVKDTKVGGLLPGGIEVRGLSGGEKRRLSIACALIANPSILFLDEPTTGLDSFAALNVMDHMSQLASMGHTVIASIHQPRPAIFDRFNKIVVLSEGYQLFNGPPSSSICWFQETLGYSYVPERDGNIPDWIMDTVSVGFTKPHAIAARSMSKVAHVQMAAQQFLEFAERNPELVPAPETTHNPVFELNDGYSASTLPLRLPAGGEEGGQTVAVPLAAANQEEAQLWASGNYAASWLKQFRVLFKRALLSQIRNPTDTSSRLLMSTWVGTLAGLVFDSLPQGASSTQQRLALLFFMLLLYQLMPFCFMSFYVADRRFFQADVTANLYAPSAYYLAAVFASAPFVIINTVAGGLMAYGLTGLRYTGYAIVLYLVILCLQSLISNQLQIFCVWLTPNQDMAYVLATGYVASSILLSGFYLRIKEIKIGFIQDLSWLSFPKYAMQGASRLELENRVWDPSTCVANQTDLATAPSECGTTGNDLLDYYGYSMSVATVIGAMLAFYAFFHLGSYLALSRLYRKR